MSATSSDIAFDMAALISELSEDEGRRSFPYTDTRGCLSIGVGRNLTGEGLSAAEIDMLLTNDIQTHIADLDANVPWWRQLDDPRQRVMVNLCFNMGWGTLSEFKNFLARMQGGDWSGAATQLQESLWWHQVGERGPRIVSLLTTGSRT